MIYEDGTKMVIYTFDTPSVPPLEEMKKVAREFPDLKFQLLYEKDGCFIQGSAWFENEESHDDCRAYGSEEG